MKYICQKKLKFKLMKLKIKMSTICNQILEMSISCTEGKKKGHSNTHVTLKPSNRKTNLNLNTLKKQIKLK